MKVSGRDVLGHEIREMRGGQVLERFEGNDKELSRKPMLGFVEWSW